MHSVLKTYSTKVLVCIYVKQLNLKIIYNMLMHSVKLLFDLKHIFLFYYLINKLKSLLMGVPSDYCYIFHFFLLILRI